VYIENSWFGYEHKLSYHLLYSKLVLDILSVSSQLILTANLWSIGLC
jgi:hypothetical protein